MIVDACEEKKGVVKPPPVNILQILDFRRRVRKLQRPHCRSVQRHGPVG